MVKQKQDFDSLDYLENIAGTNSSSAVDLSVLEEAPKYHISLDDLESLTPAVDEINDNVYQENESAGGAPVEDVPVRLSFSDVMVPLDALIEKFFRQSPRPVIVVSDDKIIYANAAFLEKIGADAESEVFNTNFLQYVASEYWNDITAGIGDLLTTGNAMPVMLKHKSGKIVRTDFWAVYIPDEHTFSFILLGDAPRPKVQTKVVSGLYDEETGLPNYYLLQDRIQVAVNNENSREISFGKNLVALICIEFENRETFARLGNTELIFKRLLARVGTGLDRHYTFARGLNQQYWIFIPSVSDYEALVSECKRLKALFDEPIEDNFTEHRLQSSFGVSIFPEPATSAKKLLEQAELAVNKAHKDGGNRIVYFGA